jgi:hypothetical protein
MRAEGKSYRDIGQQLGVQHSTVLRDLANDEQERGADAPPDFITGRDGKAYPATAITE